MNCPICSENKWHQTGIRTQKATDKRWKHGYAKIQKAVFFGVWHPHKQIVETKRCVCEKCGLVIDLPRPDEQDVIEKYKYLAIVEKDLGSTKNISKKAMKQEYKQAVQILDLAKSYLEDSSNVLDILDYGGGDGHLLLPMKEKGHNCYLIDYNRFPVDSITRLGDTLEDISGDYEFDLILCRHVLEHVASPKKLVAGFKNYLKNKGLVYAEVPIQLFGKTKPHLDPVTHLNYFQDDSFRILFESAGLKAIISRQLITTYHGNYMVIAQVLAQKANNQRNVLYTNSFEKTMSLTSASFLYRLKIKMAHPISFGKSILRNIKNKFVVLVRKS